jgi:hypothetical protein
MDPRIRLSINAEGNIATGSGTTQINAPIAGRDITYNIVSGEYTLEPNVVVSADDMAFH